MPLWTIYILRCSDGTLYTGIATDALRRLNEHNTSNRLGSHYTRARRPVSLIYQEVADTRSVAVRRECQIKRMTRKEKETLIRSSQEQST